MSKAIVAPGQTLSDIAVQYLGSEEGTFQIAQLNSLNITDELTAGQELQLPEVIDKRAKRVFDIGGYKPAASKEDKLEGIGYWIIGEDFIVQ